MTKTKSASYTSFSIPSELLVKAKERVKNTQSRKNESPIATACRFSYVSMTEMLESIVESLNRIHARLDALETHPQQ
jgi:hypothetical protein